MDGNMKKTNIFKPWLRSQFTMSRISWLSYYAHIHSTGRSNICWESSVYFCRHLMSRIVRSNWGLGESFAHFSFIFFAHNFHKWLFRMGWKGLEECRIIICLCLFMPSLVKSPQLVFTCLASIWFSSENTQLVTQLITVPFQVLDLKLWLWSINIDSQQKIICTKIQNNYQ